MDVFTLIGFEKMELGYFLQALGCFQVLPSFPGFT